MDTTAYDPATVPTMYFIGVTTGQSSIMNVFPLWAEYLGLDNAVLKGMDFPLHAEAEAYRRAVDFIKRDPLSRGALVTTHKLDLLGACSDMFEELGPYARELGEVSSISKRDGELRGHAKDPITSGLALEHFLPERYWERNEAEILILGAGGSSLALTAYLERTCRGKNAPKRIVVTNRSEHRLAEMKAFHDAIDFGIPIEYHQAAAPDVSDALVASLAPGSLIVNATGLGKDAPGSPLGDTVRFPEGAYVWDFNYRGDLLFLEQARIQQRDRNLVIEDGWIYFVHGWTRVIAEVFDIEIPTEGPRFEELSRIAASTRK
ncbi:MAG: shikimate dehydrogenase [Spirochaetales bacterium]|nr:shikimate dehydrogenase [Spirochaetales bacterium]